MRSKLLCKLNGNKILTESPDTRLLSSLVLDFLNNLGFKYSLSVFVPECGDAAQFLSPSELSEYFKLEMPANSSVLSHIISTYFSSISKPNQKSSSTQTLEESAVNVLEHKLVELDMQHIARNKEDTANMDEKILRIQRDCEKRMKLELQTHVARVRETEITAMKLEEANKYQQLLQKYKNDHEKLYSRELDALKTREKKLQDQLRSKELEIEHKDFCQRQEYLRDTEATQNRYTDARRKVDLELEELQIQKKLWEKRAQETEEKFKEVDLIKKEAKVQAIMDLTQYKLEFQNQFEEERRSLANERLEIETIKRSWNLDSDRLKNSDDRLEAYTYQLKKLTKDNESLKESCSNYEKNIDQVHKELRIISDSQNRTIFQLSARETELKITREELENFKQLVNEQKERINQMKRDHEMQVEKYKKELHEYTGRQFVSDYVIERKVYWNKLEREECEIKKGIMDIIKPAPLYSGKFDLGTVKIASEDKNNTKEQPIVTVKTQIIKAESSAGTDEDERLF